MEEILGFVGRVSRQGPTRMIIIPKRLHDKLERVADKQVMVTITDILP